MAKALEACNAERRFGSFLAWPRQVGGEPLRARVVRRSTTLLPIVWMDAHRAAGPWRNHPLTSMVLRVGSERAMAMAAGPVAVGLHIHERRLVSRFLSRVAEGVVDGLRKPVAETIKGGVDASPWTGGILG
jgi:hypothetical protein